jgi:hypothetical protein
MDLHMNRAAVGEIHNVKWPRYHEVRWVQQRIWEREAREREKASGEPSGWFVRGECDLKDYRAWKLIVADGVSLAEVGWQLFRDRHVDPNDDDPDNPDRLKRRAHLAYQRVEREFRRGPSQKK